jgi:hypothetical protein
VPFDGASVAVAAGVPVGAALGVGAAQPAVMATVIEAARIKRFILLSSR